MIKLINMKDLFDNEIILPEGGQKKDRIAVFQYKKLIAIYGKVEQKCKDCVFCQQHRAGSKRFYKCHRAKISRSQATDWNSRWQACGLFSENLTNLK